MELLGRCLKEHRDVETGQAKHWGTKEGEKHLCLCVGVRQPFVFVSGVALGR